MCRTNILRNKSLNRHIIMIYFLFLSLSSVFGATVDLELSLVVSRPLDNNTSWDMTGSPTADLDLEYGSKPRSKSYSDG